MCLECRLNCATNQVLTLSGIRNLTWLLMTYTVEMESYVVFIVMRFCKFLRNRILKTRVVMAYSARDPCTTSWHTTQCISTCANVIMVPVSLFSAVTMSEWLSLPVDQANCESGMVGIFVRCFLHSSTDGYCMDTFLSNIWFIRQVLKKQMTSDKSKPSVKLPLI